MQFQQETDTSKMFTSYTVVLLTLIYTGAQACIIGNLGRHLTRAPAIDDRRDFLEFGKLFFIDVFQDHYKISNISSFDIIDFPNRKNT